MGGLGVAGGGGSAAAGWFSIGWRAAGEVNRPGAPTDSLRKAPGPVGGFSCDGWDPVWNGLAGPAVLGGGWLG